MATLNTRIQLKYDTYTNWHTNNPVLKTGELAIAEIPADTGTVPNEPAYLLKVGNGTDHFNDLDWISGKAADVYAWAKAATKPTYQASEIKGLEDFIAGEIQDTNTKYQIVQNGNMGFKLQSQELGVGTWTDVNEITLTAPVYTLVEGSTNGTVAFNGEDVPVHGLGTAAYTASTAYDAAGAAAGVQTTLTGTASDASSANTIYGAKKYADEKATAAQTAAEGHADDLIAALDNDGQTAGTGEVISAVSQADGVISVSKKSLAEADIPALTTAKITGLDTALAGKQDTLVFNTTYNASTNKAATMTDVTNAVAGLSGAMHYVGESTTDPAGGTATVEGHEDWASGDVVTYNAKEYVYDGENWRELGDESSFAVKGSIVDADIAAGANIAQSKIAGLEAALASKATPANITSAIQALDMASVSVGTGKKITAIEEVDGVVSVTTGDIAAGDIPELPQSKIANLTTDLAAKADAATVTALDGRVDALETAIGEGGSVAQQITDAINALDKGDSNTPNQFVTSVSQNNGLISVARAQPTIANINGLQDSLDAKANTADLADVATSGLINDLTQTDTLILNCGSSSTVMD